MWGPGLINPTELVYVPLALMKFSKSPTSPHCITRMAGGVVSGNDGTPGKHTVTVTPVYGGNAKQLLSALVSSGSAVPLPLAKRILLHTLRGLAHCHERGFVHTNLDPDNIFFETPLSTNEIGEVVKRDSPLTEQFHELSSEPTSTYDYPGRSSPGKLCPWWL